VFKKLQNRFPLFKYTITGHSMEPELLQGTQVLVSSIPYLFFRPKTNDVIAFKNKEDKKIYVKRIVGIKNNTFYVLGDNKQDSKDSKSFGWITKKDIIGKVIYQT
jgi:nickel-type superoxide dismutase maturation protease